MRLRYSEAAMELRYCRVKEGTVLRQLENVLLVTSSQFQPAKKPRKHFPNASTAGTVMGPVGVPLAENQWLLTFSEKKAMYGAMRAAVGGGVDDVAGNKRKRDDSDFEPSAFHGMLSTIPSEFLHSYPTTGVIELNLATPEWALECVVAGVPYLGSCFAEAHT